MQTPETPRAPWPGPVLLETQDLASKWGFGDGDIFDHHAEWWAEQLQLPAGSMYVSSRELLHHMVETHLLPLLTETERDHIIHVVSSHNPIRIEDPVTENTPDRNGHWPRTHRRVLLEQEIKDALTTLYPVRRPAEYRLIETCRTYWMPWRPLETLMAEVETDTLHLAAENLETALQIEPLMAYNLDTAERDQRITDHFTEALELARLATQ